MERATAQLIKGIDMRTEYAVYNIANGENERFTTKDEALACFWGHVIEFAKSHFHGTAYTTIQINDDGSETWFNDCDEQIDRPLTAEEIAERIARKMPRKLEEITPVEVLPLTN